MSRRAMILGGVLVAGALGYAVLSMTGGDDPGGDRSATAPGAPMVEVALPATLGDAAGMGKAAFEAHCVTCHGENAAGKAGNGPPLVHEIYEPGHHADYAFQMAVEDGVQAHHWSFGDMPPVEGLTRSDVANIVAYVRTLQRANGIN